MAGSTLRMRYLKRVLLLSFALAAYPAFIFSGISLYVLSGPVMALLVVATVLPPGEKITSFSMPELTA